MMNEHSRLYAFTRLNKYFVIDTFTGSSFEVDEPVYRYIHDGIPSEGGREGVKELLDILDNPPSNSHLLGIIENLDRRTHRALCLNITHVCNMACRYCFASQGTYGTTPQIMSKDVAKAAIDWLVKTDVSTVDIDIFGGEPLIAWDLVKFILEYGKDAAMREDKVIRFSLTTNGLLLTSDKLSVLNEYDVNLTLSLDGDKFYNDIFRVTPDNQGTYEKIINNFLEVEKTRKGKNYYVRGTYTKWTIHFADTVKYLADLGFKVISMEPVTGQGMPWHLTLSDIPTIEKEYEKLAHLYIRYLFNGRPFNFYHFELHRYNPPSLIRRFTACGAGLEYIAVSPNGTIYPCHQFDGVEEFAMGNVLNMKPYEEPDRNIRLKFAHANALRKAPCIKCPFRALCGGGCHANGYFAQGTIMEPDPVQCEIIKIRLEYAIAVNSFFE